MFRVLEPAKLGEKVFVGNGLTTDPANLVPLFHQDNGFPDLSPFLRVLQAQRGGKHVLVPEGRYIYGTKEHSI